MTETGEQTEQQELLAALEDVLWQACSHDGELDSCALSSYADGLRLLARHGRVEIVLDVGKRVRAKLVVKASGDGERLAGVSPVSPVAAFCYPVMSAEEAAAELLRLPGELSASLSASSSLSASVTGLYLRNGVGASGVSCVSEGEQR